VIDEAPEPQDADVAERTCPLWRVRCGIPVGPGVASHTIRAPFVATPPPEAFSAGPDDPGSGRAGEATPAR
jgi:hypothetical protein